MALAPRKPDLNNPKDIERYEKDMAEVKANPHKWNVVPSMITKQIANQEKVRQAVIDVKKNIDSTPKPKRSYRKKQT